MPGTTRSIEGVTSIRSGDETVSDLLGQSSLFSIRGHMHTQHKHNPRSTVSHPALPTSCVAFTLTLTLTPTVVRFLQLDRPGRTALQSLREVKKFEPLFMPWDAARTPALHIRIHIPSVVPRSVRAVSVAGPSGASRATCDRHPRTHPHRDDACSLRPFPILTLTLDPSPKLQP